MGDDIKIPDLPTTGRQGALAAAYQAAGEKGTSTPPAPITETEVKVGEEFDDSQVELPKASDKPEQKTEDKSAVKPEEKPAAKKDEIKPFGTTPVAGQPGARDYSNIPPEWLPYAKGLNNKLFDDFKVKLPQLIAQAEAKYKTELEAIKKEKPGYLAEHPESYKLDPEYNKIQNELEINTYLQQHYQAELLKAARGENWRSITDFKDGEPVYAEHKGTGQRDVQSELAINGLINKLDTANQLAKQQLGNYQAGFQKLIKDSEAFMAKIENKFFPTWDETKLTEKEKGYIKAIDGVIPPVFRHQKAWGLVKKISVGYYNLLDKYNEAITELENLREKGEARREGGGGKPSGGGEASDADIVDLTKDPSEW